MTTLQFLGQELRGVYDTTAAPLIDAAAHPVQAVENTASNLMEGVKDVAKDPKGTLTGAGGWPTLSNLVPGDAPPLSRLLCDRVGGKQNA
jgi:hypothetical protein